jgi:hypothetical protein
MSKTEPASTWQSGRAFLSALLLLVVTSFHARPAIAQTAEETAFFMVHGIEFERLEQKVKSEGKGTLKFIKKNDCQYVLSSDSPEGTGESIFDFTNFRGYTLRTMPVGGSTNIVASGKGLVSIFVRYKKTGKEEKFSNDEWDISSLNNEVSLERLRKAEQFFRTKYCKGRAF